MAKITLRKFHKYISLLIAIQLLLWTISGIYFSFNKIENIRGVSISKGTLDILLELDWIKPKGRRQSPGRPLTWGTTETFLDVFGLQDLSSLPGMADLKSAGLVGSKPLITDDLSSLDENNDANQELLIQELAPKNN